MQSKSKKIRSSGTFAFSLFAQLSCIIVTLIVLSGYLFVLAPTHASIAQKDEIINPFLAQASPKPVQYVEHDDVYQVIRNLFELGLKNRRILLEKLTTQNIFNIPTDSPLNWTCPTNIRDRISLPNLVNHTRAADFRANKKGTWLLYQHLRKAGGTGFCDLAQNNLPRRQTPPYFCMIDNRGSLATPPWNSEEYLMSRMERNEYRITANEWDAYFSYMGDWRGAVLATTFRHPVDRWYSQYRFEHLEHRDGSTADAPRRPFRTWYNNNKAWTMGTNYYVTTFEGTPDPHPPKDKGDFYWTYHKFWQQQLSWDTFSRSLRNVRKFHVVLVTDWLDFAPPIIEEVLGWKTPPKKVLPHADQAKRDANYKRVPVVDMVGQQDYNFILEENVFDLLYYQCMQRLFLERLHSCDKY